MDDKEIRKRIRTRMLAGELKTIDGTVTVARAKTRYCAACELPIRSGDDATLGYRYMDWTQWFHLRCAILWDEERRPN
jgi:hypothetical protein